jgi:hypothetical protein
MVLLLLLVLLIPITVHAGDKVAIREYLVEQGYTNDQITYDMGRKIVKLDSRDFYGTSPKEDSKTYAKSNILDELIADHKRGKYTVYMEAPVRMIK